MSAASVNRWRAREREQSDARPDALGASRKSQLIDAHKDAVLAALGPDADRTIEEVRGVLADQGLMVSYGVLQRFFRRHKITRKKRPLMPASRAVPTC